VRFGVDSRAGEEDPGGRGRWVREVVAALARRGDDHTYDLYARRPWEVELDDRFRWRLIGARDPIWHRRAARAAADSDAFLSTNSYLTTWFLRVPGVVVVHDLIPFIPGVSARRSSNVIEHLTLARGTRRAARIVCDSEATRRDLLERYPSLADKTTTVTLGVDEHFRRRRTLDEIAAARNRHGLDRPFVLAVGTLEPRKNLARVLEAFATLPAAVRNDRRLAVVGAQGWDFSAILESARLQGEIVTLLGRIDDEDLAALYQACDTFVFASLYEGFGLPLLEALASGAPSITSNVSSLPEVGGDAVLYVDPIQTQEIRAALEEVLSSEETRNRLRTAGPGQAAGFSWDRTAAGLLAQLAAATRS
jgi:glycosyltransferase involved in cell wall biosynthesis